MARRIRQPREPPNTFETGHHGPPRVFCSLGIGSVGRSTEVSAGSVGANSLERYCRDSDDVKRFSKCHDSCRRRAIWTRSCRCESPESSSGLFCSSDPDRAKAFTLAQKGASLTHLIGCGGLASALAL